MTRRLLLSYLSLTLLVLLGLEVPYALTYAAEQRQRAGQALERETTVLAEFAEEAIEEDQTQMLPRLAAEYATSTGGRVLILDADGHLLASSHPLTSDDRTPGDLAEIRTALDGRRATGVRHSSALDTDLRYVAAPAASGTTIRGAVRVAVPNDTLDATVHRMWTTLALVGAGVLAVVAAVGFALARWVTRPIRALEQVTDQLASGSLTAPAATDLGPPELRRLATTFNHTATRLQQLLHTQRAFAADASHQLRTPLTALRLRLENLEPDLAAPGHPNLDAAITEIDRLAQMIEGLLALARMDNADTTPQPVDLDAIITDRAHTWAPLTAERNIRLTIAGERGAHVLAVPGALPQILDNLLANALRVAPAGSRLTIAYHRTRHPDHAAPPTVVLHVIDQGPGMTAEHRTRAFDRFWRAPDAPKGGSGLGLAIVARLVHASGGHIALRPAPGTGLDATLTLRPANPGASVLQGAHGRHAQHTPPQQDPLHASRP